MMKLGSEDAVVGLKQALAPAEHITTLTINVPAIVDNVRLLQKAAGASRVIAVIKGLGYGTDPVMLGRILEAQGVDGLAVAYAEEGVRLREAGIKPGCWCSIRIPPPSARCTATGWSLKSSPGRTSSERMPGPSKRVCKTGPFI